MSITVRGHFFLIFYVIFWTFFWNLPYTPLQTTFKSLYYLWYIWLIWSWSFITSPKHFKNVYFVSISYWKCLLVQTVAPNRTDSPSMHRSIYGSFNYVKYPDTTEKQTPTKFQTLWILMGIVLLIHNRIYLFPYTTRWVVL